jgi:ribose 5-phosphate isomerase B
LATLAIRLVTTRFGLSLKRLAPDVAVEVTEAFLAVEEADPEEGENIAALDRLLPP